MQFLTKSRRILLGTLFVYAALVAGHLGEFWPFSVYPMFSQAGGEWTRAVVRVVPDAESLTDLRRETLLHTVVAPDSLPGRPLPLEELNVNQNDVANFVSKTAAWTDAQVRNLRQLLQEGLRPGDGLLVYRVRGAPTEDDRVRVRCEPVFLFTGSSTHPGAVRLVDG